jgi:arylsulfatase A-like enzyme
MPSFLLVVFDGLRPDMLSAANTPNLLRFAGMGTRFAHARSVFPSETRVCSASVATGCLPRRHGLVANRMAHPTDPSRLVDTGDVAVLRALQQETGAPLLDAPSLADLLARAGQDCAVLSSGTTGQTFVLNPNADALGAITISAHGPHACSSAGRALMAECAPPPTASADRAEWIAELFRTRFLPAPPAATILWLCEPDSTGHYGGLGSPAQSAALRRTDAAFGRILDDWQAGPQRDTLQIAVASDHGQATVTGLHDVAASLIDFPGCTLLAGSSAGLVIPGADAARIAEIAEFLTRQPWAGAIYAADRARFREAGLPDSGLPPGVLPRSALLCDHPRAAHILFTLRTSSGAAASGLPGTTLYDGNLAIGAGTHGGLSPAELHIVLMLAGSAIRPGTLSEWPAGLPDIAPTALTLLGLPGAAAMDGRILAEALVDGAEPTDSPAPESWDARSPTGYTQRLARTRLGRHCYLDQGVRD